MEFTVEDHFSWILSGSFVSRLKPLQKYTSGLFSWVSMVHGMGGRGRRNFNHVFKTGRTAIATPCSIFTLQRFIEQVKHTDAVIGEGVANFPVELPFKRSP